MTAAELISELHSSLTVEMPLPAGGLTATRHLRLMEFGRKNLSLARLSEAHFDALAILAEAGCTAQLGAIYGVWAAEIPGQGLELTQSDVDFLLNGVKPFCSGGQLVDHALVTVTRPKHRLVDIDLRAARNTITFDESGWKSQAFQQTRTAAITFANTPISKMSIVGDVGWYLERPGFWHGAVGPAACWAGGAQGLVDYAFRQNRSDPHTIAHFAAMQASVWAMQSILVKAGQEIDEDRGNRQRAQIRALTVRHLIELVCSDVSRRFARAYGPYPLAMNEETVQRYQELELYLRQSHAERDLESLGRLIHDH